MGSRAVGRRPGRRGRRRADRRRRRRRHEDRSPPRAARHPRFGRSGRGDATTSPSSQELLGKAGSYAGLRFSVDTTDPERGALMQRVEERSTAIATRVIFFELEWAALTDERVDELLADDRLSFCPALPPLGPPLPHAPAHGARGEDPRREGSHRRECVVATLQRAHLHDRGEDRRRGRRSRAGPGSARITGPRGPTHRRGGGDRRARARAADARVRVQHLARGQEHRRPAAVVLRLDRESQPGERGERRVRARARDRGAGPQRHPAAVVLAEGAAARRRPARRLRPDGERRVGRRGVRLDRGPRARAGRVRVVRAGARRGCGPVLRRRLDRRAGPARQAARRVLRVHGAVAAPVRAAQLDLAPA